MFAMRNYFIIRKHTWYVSSNLWYNKKIQGKTCRRYVLSRERAKEKGIYMNIKTFEELTTREVYEILKARCSVFVMEQNIHYLDMDDVDYRSIHIFETDEDLNVTAYLRMYLPDDDPDTYLFGRVLSVSRGSGTGRKLLEEAGRYAVSMGKKKLMCDAQKQSMGFYEKCGFERVSEDFIEAGIPHLKMEKWL